MSVEFVSYHVKVSSINKDEHAYEFTRTSENPKTTETTLQIRTNQMHYNQTAENYRELKKYSRNSGTLAQH